MQQNYLWFNNHHHDRHRHHHHCCSYCHHSYFSVPRPPPPLSPRGFAALHFMPLPPISYPSAPFIASAASSFFSNSTNANPRDSPVSLSMIIFASFTVPYFSKHLYKSSLLALYARLRTKTVSRRDIISDNELDEIVILNYILISVTMCSLIFLSVPM